jgi:hypothetical protein
MWVIVHTWVGLALASILHLPFWQMVLVVLAAHVLLDLVPHWDYTADRGRLFWGSVDVFAALGSVIALPMCGLPFAVAVMGVISGAPDLDVVGSAAGGRETQPIFPSHWPRFPHGHCGPAVGIPLQLAIVAVSAGAVLSVGL